MVKKIVFKPPTRDHRQKGLMEAKLVMESTPNGECRKRKQGQ